MSKWCNTCHHSEYPSCDHNCIVCGKDFEELAEVVIKQREEIDALRWTNKQLVKNEKKKRIELWKKAITQFMDKLKTERSYTPNLSIDGKEVVNMEDVEVVAKEMLDQKKSAFKEANKYENNN